MKTDEYTPPAEIGVVTGPAVWAGPEVMSEGGWLYNWDSGAREELENLVRELCREKNLSVHDIALLNPDLPMLKEFLAPIRRDLVHGRGFAKIEGFELGDFTDDELRVALWLMGRQLGLIVPQGEGAMPIGDVTDMSDRNPEFFYYEIGGPLPMHMDPADLVGLLCLRGAKSGGESVFVSSKAVHNTILHERPDILRLLYRGFKNYRRNRGRKGESILTDYYVPVFLDIGGEFVCSFNPSMIYNAIEFGGLVLDDEEQEAFDFFVEVTNRPELVFEMPIAPGEIQFLNNRLNLHARRDYEDFEGEMHKRHLLRVWTMVRELKKLPMIMPHYDPDTGSRAA